MFSTKCGIWDDYSDTCVSNAYEQSVPTPAQSSVIICYGILKGTSKKNTELKISVPTIAGIVKYFIFLLLGRSCLVLNSCVCVSVGVCNYYYYYCGH